MNLGILSNHHPPHTIPKFIKEFILQYTLVASASNSIILKDLLDFEALLKASP